MSSEEFKAVETKRQELLRQLAAAESALRGAAQTRGFGGNAQAHMERALAHVQEAYLTVNEARAVRTVHQLADDLNRVEQVVTKAKCGQSQHI